MRLVITGGQRGGVYRRNQSRLSFIQPLSVCCMAVTNPDSDLHDKIGTKRVRTREVGKLSEGEERVRVEATRLERRRSHAAPAVWTSYSRIGERPRTRTRTRTRSRTRHADDWRISCGGEGLRSISSWQRPSDLGAWNLERHAVGRWDEPGVLRVDEMRKRHPGHPGHPWNKPRFGCARLRNESGRVSVTVSL